MYLACAGDSAVSSHGDTRRCQMYAVAQSRNAAMARKRGSV
jgi:hypothetical protein